MKKVTNSSGTVTTTNYTLHGSNLVRMVRGSTALHFFYDAQNRPAIVDYAGTKYAYVYSLQGDVLGLVNSSGTEVVRYVYDAWGKVLATTGTLASTVGAIQPFRYRGYIYDTETGLYYLRSRYYNPTWGRFLNADTVIEGNLYCYCSNTPIMRIDSNGNIDKETLSYSGMEIKKSLYYFRDAVLSKIYLKELYDDIEVYPKKGILRIPNNTQSARKFLDLVIDARSDYFFEHDWANMMAKVAIRKYRDITGNDYEQDTDISIEKVTFEIRVHEQLYEADMFTDHTDITDVSPDEGKGWMIHVQTIIDLLYDIGLR